VFFFPVASMIIFDSFHKAKEKEKESCFSFKNETNKRNLNKDFCLK